MIPDSAGFLPAKTPTVAFCELYLGIPVPHLCTGTPALYSFDLSQSSFLPTVAVHPRGAVMCARALTRALLSLNISFGRRPTRLPTSARDRSLSPPFCGFFGAHYLLSKGGNRCPLLSSGKERGGDIITLIITQLLAPLAICLGQWWLSGYCAVFRMPRILQAYAVQCRCSRRNGGMWPLPRHLYASGTPRSIHAR